MADVVVNHIGNRETRLRNKIDYVADQRDQALEELWDERTKNEHLESRNERLMYDNRDLRKSREKWKERAVAAEQMVKQMTKAKKRGLESHSP